MARRATPGRPVRGSSTGRPIMAALDLLGRRWVLRIVWELHQRPMRFRELETATGASPTIVNARLGDLREAGVVEIDDISGYRLTALGAELVRVLAPLNAWSERWARR
jgi:DNA-binding HxlR family transcriptional regulator